MNWIKNTFYLSLVVSLLIHTTILFYDNIKLKLTFELNEDQQKEVKKIENNERLVEKTKHTEKDKEILKEHFKCEKEKFIEQAKKEFLTKEIEKKENEEENKEESRLAEIAKNFGSFATADTDKKKQTKKTISKPLTLTYVGEKEEVEESEQACQGQTYVGLGLQLGEGMVVRGGVFDFSIPKEVSPWKIAEVSSGDPGERLNMKKGDVFLGMKDSNGVFWEGNTLLSQKNVKAGMKVEVIFAKNDKVIATKTELEEICYTEK